MKIQNIQTLAILATQVQLVSDIAMDVLGNGAATEISGEKVTQSSSKLLAAATINKTISEKCHA